MNEETTRDITNKEDKVGLGGWLIWFQIRIYVGIVSMFQIIFGYYVRLGYKVLAIVILALSVGTLALFYKKQSSFKAVYIFAVIAVLVLYLILHEYYYLLGSVVVETFIIISLFRSSRVQNTFEY